jgi:hypothetical protein
MVLSPSGVIGEMQEPVRSPDTRGSGASTPRALSMPMRLLAEGIVSNEAKHRARNPERLGRNCRVRRRTSDCYGLWERSARLK